MINAPPHTLADRLEQLQERITRACQRAGRDRKEVTLVGVSKTFPAEAVSEAFEAGLRDFGENKVQELVAKASLRPGERNGGHCRWHMIGHLQRNKAKEVIAHADLFHALDSLRLAKELDKRAAQQGRMLPCLVQVNVSNEDTKFGLLPRQVGGLLDQLAPFKNLKVLGLMTLASPADNPERVRPEFQQLRRLLEDEDKQGRSHVSLRHLSMGMSGDFEVAIEEGATLIRVGSLLFGARS